MSVTFFHTLQSFGQFLKNWTLGGGGLVDPNVANMRAEICVGCHANLPSGDARKGCGVCNKGANAFLDAIRGSVMTNRTTPSDSKLLACGICGCDLKLSVHFPNHALLPRETANAYPDFCWKKKILTNEEI